MSRRAPISGDAVDHGSVHGHGLSMQGEVSMEGYPQGAQRPPNEKGCPWGAHRVGMPRDPPNEKGCSQGAHGVGMPVSGDIHREGVPTGMGCSRGCP